MDIDWRKQLQRIIDEQKIAVTRVSKDAEMNRSTLEKVIKGADISVERFLRVCRVLRVRPGEILEAGERFVPSVPIVGYAASESWTPIAVSGKRGPSTEDANSGLFWREVCTGSEPLRLLCTGYIRGLVDMNDAATVLLKRPFWCADGVRSLEQLRLVIIKALDDKPQDLHLAFGPTAVMALGRAFPCPQWKQQTGKR